MELSWPEYWVGSLSLLQGIFPTQGLNQGLPPCRQILYQLSYQGSLVVNKIGVLLDGNSYKAEATLLDKSCSLVCYFSLINEETRFQEIKQLSSYPELKPTQSFFVTPEL